MGAVTLILAIDVGNTHIVLGCLNIGESNDPNGRIGKIENSFRLTTMIERTSDEFGLLFLQFLTRIEKRTKDIEGCIISSVVPPIMHSLVNGVKRYLDIEPVVVNYNSPLNMKILYDNPREVGVDRLVNAVAGRAKYGTPLIIIDFGTATTYCAVNKDGDYVGGAICPGIKLSLDALVSKTAKLPRIEIVRPDNIIGKNTVMSMQSGLYYGIIGEVDAISRRMKKELGDGVNKVRTIATGGLANLIANDSAEIEEVDRNLTLDGLGIIWNDL